MSGFRFSVVNYDKQFYSRYILHLDVIIRKGNRSNINSIAQSYRTPLTPSLAITITIESHKPPHRQIDIHPMIPIAPTQSIIQTIHQAQQYSMENS